MKLNKYALLTLSLIAVASSSFAQSSAVTLPKKAATAPTKSEATIAEETAATPAALEPSVATPSTTGVSGTSTVQIKNPEESEAKPLSISLGVEMAEKIVKDQTSAKENTLSLLIAPAYKINETFSMAGKIVINQDNYAQHETTASDATLSLGIKGFKLNEGWTTVHSIGTVIPVSDVTVKNDRLKGNISISNGIAFTGVYFDLTYKLSLGRNFHQFTQNIEGSPNVQYRIAQSMEIKIPVTDAFYLSTTGVYKYGRTYGGYERLAFVFDADMNYDFSPQFSVNVGTSNDGASVKANGVDSNITAYNENYSVVRLGVSYQY